MALKIGVIADSFRMGFAESIKKAAEVGAAGVQIYATHGEFSPEMTPSQRREKLDIIHSHGLVVSALCGDFGGHGFAIEADNAERIEKSKRVMDLAKEFGCSVVTTHIGVVPSDPSNPRMEIMRKACIELGRYGDEVGAAFAIETGPETSAVLKKFIDSLGVKGVRVNFDPANLVMVSADDPVAGALLLGDYIVHTHAKDGIQLKKSEPERIYNSFAGHDEVIVYADYFKEVPLGTGGVDFDRYLPALASTGFDGFLTIEREVGGTPEKDIREAVIFLKEKLAKLGL